MADYYQVKNQNIFTPPANISLGNTSNQYSNVYVQNNLVVGNVTVTSSTIIAPRVTTITYPGNDTAADPAGGQTITLTGSGFVVSASILINSIAVSVVSVVSSTEITFTSPANSSGSYVIYVVNPDGSTAIAVPGIQYSGIPTWTTAAGTLGSLYETANFSQTVTATGDAPITYSVASGTLPPGATFNGNGTITGTSQLTASPTTYTFTVSATDAEQQDTNRSFSLTINTDVVTWTTPADNSTTTLSQNSASTTTLLATSAAGKTITYTANALPTGLSISGATVTGTPTVIGNTTSLFTATAATTGRTTTATINWTISVANDLYFPYTTLLLSGQTSTSTFIADASTNNFALTITGDTKPNNFNPYTPGYYSNYFDGNGDYLTLPNNAALAFGTGDFTVETWIYPTDAGQFTIAVISNFQFFTYGNSLYFNDAVIPQVNGGTITTSAWQHVAISRSGTAVKGFINGSQVFSTTSSVNFTSSNNYIAFNAGSAYGQGYLSNLRILKGTALYTSAFTPPSSPLTAIANTSLLTCQSNRFIDNSTNAFTITVVGNTTVNPTNPFVPNTAYATYGSTYFDGTGDYLTAPSNAAFAFGTGDFTIECWIYLTGSNVSYRTIVSTRASNGTSTGWCLATNASGDIYIYANAFIVTAASAIVPNVWYHVAVCRVSGTTTLYLNGVSKSTSATARTYSDSTVTISNEYYLSGEYWQGYISTVRLIKGTAVYTSNFTPSTTPLTAVANTSLLTLQTNQPVNNNVFLDNSTNAFVVTRAGNTTQGTFSPYGANWSNYFDGTGDFLGQDGSAATNFSGVDWTIETWVYISITPTDYTGIIQSKTGINNWIPYLGIGLMADGRINCSLNGTNNTTTQTITQNTWNHLALVRSSGVVKLYINGVASSVSVTVNIVNSNLGYWFGKVDNMDGGGGTNGYLYYFTGYLSNTRFVKGTAVYTSNFTPPTAPLTAITNTSLLTCQSNRFIDNSTNNFTITKFGDVSVQRFSPFSPGVTYSTSTIGGSGYFDGSDYLAVTTASSVFDFSTGNFTIEMWANPSTQTSSYPSMIACAAAWSTGAFYIRYSDTLGANKFAVFLAPSDPLIMASSTSAPNAWHHVAVTRNGTTITLWVDGVSLGTATNSSSINLALGGGVWLGNNGSASCYYTGLLSNVRVVKGTAVYTSAFTPPTAPLTAITNTSLLLNYTSAGIIDNTMINNLETVGDAKISTAQSKFGSGSMYFDGTGDYLTVPANNIFATGTGNFTIEGWIYVTDLSAIRSICGTRTIADTTTGWNLAVLTTGSMQIWDNTPYAATGAGSVVVNTWYNFAFVRLNNVIYSYINGIQKASTAVTRDWTQKTFWVGVNGGDPTNGAPLNGYINDLRFTKGYARYTANFAPPTAAFPTY